VAPPDRPARTAGGKIVIPFAIDTPGMLAEGMREIGPDDPQFKAWDRWLAATEHAAAAEPAGRWTVTGEIPDTGEQVTLAWDDGVAGWPADALDWAVHAATEGLVQLDDGPRLLAWLTGQGFTRQE
jgi:hypothetical protein